MTRRDDAITDRTVAIVLAGGKGKRLYPLTENICKPALPFGGVFRCIDFSLSNCVNSGLHRIAVATQYKPDALLAHLWRRWNSVAVGEQAIVRAWRAEERAERFGCCGTADAVYRNLPSIRDLEHSLVLVLAGDHVYKMDYRPMLEAHVARNADVTIACVEVPAADARRLGIAIVAADGRVEHLIEKPASLAELSTMHGGHVLASMGVYVFDGSVLARALALDAAQSESGHDFAADVLPQLLAGRHAYSYAFRGADDGSPAYWRDIGTLDAYWRAHMELLEPEPLMTLDDRAWPIGRVAAAPLIGAATTTSGGTVANSIVAASCSVAGGVARCVLSEDVEIGLGATVADSIVLPGASVGAGSRLRGVIVDAGQSVAERTMMERAEEDGAPPVLVKMHRPARRTPG